MMPTAKAPCPAPTVGPETPLLAGEGGQGLRPADPDQTARTRWSTRPWGRCTALRAFVCGTRGAAGIEFALGAVALLSVAALCFDLYSRVEADTASARLAAVMADYVSRGPDPGDSDDTLDGNALKALGKFLHERELGVPADLVYVITALRQSSGTPTLPAVEVLWHDDRNLRFGESTVTEELADDCSRYVKQEGGGDAAKLPADFKLVAGEVVVIVEVCARLTREGSITGRFVAGDLYRLHVLPGRAPERDLRKPVYAERRRGGDGTEALVAASRRAESVPPWPAPTAPVPGALGGAAPSSALARSATARIGLPATRA